jgi:hypothetical protein
MMNQDQAAKRKREEVAALLKKQAKGKRQRQMIFEFKKMAAEINAKKASASVSATQKIKSV